METFYLGVVIFLFLLAIFDLMVGVSNDAVNFLGAAVGARAASFRWILGVAALGVLCGALMSNGMMDVARHGIFRPEHFYFQEIIVICMAVMATDVILLDTFNTLGLPTSTTVSLVFELLGASVALAMLKLLGDESGLTLAELINTEKALTVIFAIFLSVAVAFLFGTVVQYLTRLLFTFNYQKHLRWSAGLFGGTAVTAIIYFLLIKGVKGASFMTPEVQDWIMGHTGEIVACSWIASIVLMQVVHWCKVNIFKVIVMLGTFALALAFAGNDLVNFVGVPLTGYASYTDYIAHGNGSESFLMNSLNAPASTPFVFLAAAGVVMLVSLVTSKKAHNVIKTSVDLARQGDGDEMFGSSALARRIVRTSSSISQWVDRVTPAPVKRWIDARFNKEEMIIADGAAYDMVRAAINLLLASLLVALGTSLKLPLSTTYVAFMVAMGTSLADRAWSRESAVFRITGVISVIGGWFITAGVAFVASFLVALVLYYGGPVAMVASVVLVVFLLVRSQIQFRRKAQEQKESDDTFRRMMTSQDKAEVWMLLRDQVAGSLAEALQSSEATYRQLTDGFFKQEMRPLRAADKTLSGEKAHLKRMRRRQVLGMRRIDPLLALEKNTWFHTARGAAEQIHYCLIRIYEPCNEHVENNFSPLEKERLRDFLPLRRGIFTLMSGIRRMILTDDFVEMERLMESAQELREAIALERRTQIHRVQEEHSNLQVGLVYLNLLQESEELVALLRHLLRAANKFRL